MMHRRGSLSISTNAIVVLIIAVIMLGLMIGLVTRGFGAVERQFLAQIENTEQPPSTPTSATPITISSGTILTAAGELAGLKVNILNTAGAELTNLRPRIDCPLNPDLIDAGYTQQVLPKDATQLEVTSYTYVFKIGGSAAPGTNLCRVSAVADQSVAGDIRPVEIQIVIED